MESRVGRTRKKRRLVRNKIESQRKITNRLRGKRSRLATPPEEEDRISELPEEILVSILSGLTLREAVRTSVLSKRWRYLWTCISVLNFDPEINNLSCHCSKRPNRRLLRKGRSQYIKMVSSVLGQLMNGCPDPNVEEFYVCYDLNNSYASNIDQWIEFALSNRVHTIKLNLSNSSRLPPNTKYYTLQSKLIMGLSTALGFKSLKTLSFNAVNVGDEAIEYLLSHCPLLEQLFIHQNNALRNLKLVRSALMLKYLEVVACDSIDTIEICDTNLVSFCFCAGINYEPKMVIKNTPQLVEMSVGLDSTIRSVHEMFSDFRCCFSLLQILQLGVHHSTQEILSDYMLPELENLKEFTLAVERWSNDSFLGYLVMIKNWPNLEKFALEFYFERGQEDDEEEGQVATEDVREATKYHHHSLKEVKIVGYRYHSCDFELVKQIIENAVALEKIIIDTHEIIIDSDRDSDSDSESECDSDSDIYSDSDSDIISDSDSDIISDSDSDSDIISDSESEDSESDEDYGELRRRRLEQQLRAQVPPRIELVML